MQEPDLFKIFVDPLEELAIPYIVTGAVASIIYGEPRLTHDVDLVLELKVHDVRKLIKNRSLENELRLIEQYFLTTNINTYPI